MSRFNSASAVTPTARAIAAIQSVMVEEGQHLDKQLAGNMFSLESLDSARLSNVDEQYTSIRNSLESSYIGEELLANVPENIREMSLEAATMTIMMSKDARGLLSAISTPAKSGGNQLVDANVGNNLDYVPAGESFSLEGYDPASMDEFMAHSVLANAMGVIQGEFEETFFPTQVVAAGQDGVDVTVTIPKVYSSVARSSSNQFLSKINKQSIVDALLDSSVLARTTTEIVPHAVPGNASALVSAGDVPNWNREIDGVLVPTRPLAFGKAVDLIHVSEVAALLNGGSHNETDALDSVINIGTIYVELTHANGGAPAVPETVVVAMDVSGAPGSLLVQTAEGSTREFQANLRTTVTLNQDTKAVSGDMDAFIALLETDLSVTPGNDFSYSFEVNVSATANTETARAEAYGNSATLVSASAGGSALTITTLDSALSTSMLGWYPKARRSNRNLRSTGILVDSTGSVTYRFPVPLSTPLISQKPVGADINTSLEGLSQVLRIRNNNNAVGALVAMENLLRGGASIPSNNPAIGGELVTPTFIERTCDIDDVVSLGSADALIDVRGALVAAITNVANELACKSGYLAALELVTGLNRGYEVIVATDCYIFPFLMESGDERTFGQGRDFKVTQVLNRAIENKIYVTFRRKERDGNMHGLDFGAHLYKPTLVAKLATSRAGSTSDEIHTIPANVHYVTLPILGVINVDNLESYYVD